MPAPSNTEAGGGALRIARGVAELSVSSEHRRPEMGGSHEALDVAIPLGWRVAILGDLHLQAEASPCTRALTQHVAKTLAEWNGPGVVMLCGGLCCPPARLADALDAHPALQHALGAFTREPHRRVVVLPSAAERDGLGDPASVTRLRTLGVEVAAEVTLRATTAAGEKLVVVRAGDRPGAPRPVAPRPVPEADRSWLEGLERLEEPDACERFVTSRLLYRRLGRYVWWLLVPMLVALALRVPMVATALTHIFAGASGPKHALARAQEAAWTTRLGVAMGVTVVELLALVTIVGLLSRRFWVALGGDRLPRLWAARGRSPSGLGGDRDATSLLEARFDEARAAVATGAAGLIVGGTLRAELVHLGDGFFATPGGTAEIVREHRGRLGLPPVFLHHVQASFLELETGADLHVRLMHARADLPKATLLERLASTESVVKGRKATADLHPVMVGSWPRGTSWPPPPDPSDARRRARRARRLAATAIFLAGVVDILVALTPPLRSHLHLVEQYLPLAVAEAAGALVALAGVGLVMLARGVLRGQRRAWGIAVAVLVASLLLHLLRGTDLDSLVLSVAVLALLVVQRPHFGGATDHRATRSAVLTVLSGAALATVSAVATVEVSGHVRGEHIPAWPQVLLGATERLVGLDTVVFPRHINEFLAPSLLAIGLTLFVISLFLATRPVVDRGLSAGSLPNLAGTRRAAELRARDIVRRHGTGSLDYFALRDDKRWFFHRDGLVAYAVYGGVCLVSPDPIGPVQDRAHVWQAFRHHADRCGWAIAVMGGSEEWLPTYRDAGMHYLYIGDEAIVDVTSFSLEGGKMKGLRQACTRLERYGYRVEFSDPSRASPELAASIRQLMTRNRRGRAERGFSMCLGRVFEPRDTGLLLVVVWAPDGTPAAMCQFVPAPAIDGYSLDLMRRDPGDHPNGLLDFALCSTIEHLRNRGVRSLSLNFAAMRSTIEGAGGDGVTQRVERWALRRMSEIFPIESLWRFNAKYKPEWLPRYIVYDAPEQFASAVAAILRAESLSEMPVVGRFLAAPTPSDANQR